MLFLLVGLILGFVSSYFYLKSSIRSKYQSLDVSQVYETLEVEEKFVNRYDFTVLPIANVIYVFVDKNGTVYVGTHTGIAQV